MPRPVDLHPWRDLRSSGMSSRRLQRLLGSAELVRVRPGVYAPGAEWATLAPEQRIVARAHALTMVSASRPVFSHETAAALHGLPLFRPDPQRVHVVTSSERPGAAVGLVRHRGDPESDTMVIDGLRCTSIERTVADVARTSVFDAAVVVADAALRIRCTARTGGYDADAADATRAAVREIAARSAQGGVRADRVLTFADGRAQLPGESISRIRLRQLGFRRIELQVPVPWPGGRPRYYVDFGLDDPGVVALGEFDGDAKYVDPQLRGARSTREVVDDEKKREDWIRGRTQRRFVRWNWTHVTSSSALGRRLASFGIVPPG